MSQLTQVDIDEILFTWDQLSNNNVISWPEAHLSMSYTYITRDQLCKSIYELITITFRYYNTVYALFDCRKVWLLHFIALLFFSLIIWKRVVQVPHMLPMVTMIK